MINDGANLDIQVIPKTMQMLKYVNEMLTGIFEIIH